MSKLTTPLEAFLHWESNAPDAVDIDEVVEKSMKGEKLDLEGSAKPKKKKKKKKDDGGDVSDASDLAATDGKKKKKKQKKEKTGDDVMEE